MVNLTGRRRPNTQAKKKGLMMPTPKRLWDGVIAGYAKKYLRRQAWRVKRDMDFADLLQEAWILFEVLRREYPDANERQFMALWKKSLKNRLINLSTNNLAARCRWDEVYLGDNAESFPSAFDPFEELEWGWKLEEAPQAIKTLVAAVRRREFAGKRRLRFARRQNGGRETTNELLCRLAGLPKTTALRDLLESWLSPV